MKHIFNCIFILVSLNLFAQEYAIEAADPTWAEDSVATVAVEWADVALEDHGSGFALPFGTTGFTLILLCVGAIAVIAYKKIRKSIQPTASVPAKAGEEPVRCYRPKHIRYIWVILIAVLLASLSYIGYVKFVQDKDAPSPIEETIPGL